MLVVWLLKLEVDGEIVPLYFGITGIIVAVIGALIIMVYYLLTKSGRRGSKTITKISGNEMPAKITTATIISSSPLPSVAGMILPIFSRNKGLVIKYQFTNENRETKTATTRISNRWLENTSLNLTTKGAVVPIAITSCDQSFFLHDYKEEPQE